MIELIPRIKVNEPSLLSVHQNLPIKSLVVTIQDVLSSKCEFNSTFWKIKSARGIHRFLQEDKTIILSTIMKDLLLSKMSLSKYIETIDALKPNFCLTPDCESYGGESYYALNSNRVLELYYDQREVTWRNIFDSCKLAYDIKMLRPDLPLIGLVKGSTPKQIMFHINFFKSIGINDMAFHVGDFFRNGSPKMVYQAKYFSGLIRRNAKTLFLFGMGSQNRLIEFSFADAYVTFNHFVTARNGKVYSGLIKLDHHGYSVQKVRHNLIQMLLNVSRVNDQQKLMIGGECPWEVDQEVVQEVLESLTQETQVKEALTP